MDELTIGYALVHQALPAAVAAVAAAALWLLVCRWVHRDAQPPHREVIRLPDDYESSSLDVNIATVAAARRRLAGRGSPADRLFVFGLATLSIVALAYLSLWSAGVFPASAKEREFIGQLQQSPFAQSPQMTDALAAAHDSIYVSRQHFLAVEAAFKTVAVSTRARAN